MEKIKVDVVGLSHGDYRDRTSEFLAEALGKRLTLQKEPENPLDSYAVRVRQGVKKVGYVAVPDLEVVHQAIKGSGGGTLLKGVVVECIEKPPKLRVELEAEQIDWDYSPFDDSVYDGWDYSGMSLIPPELTAQNDLTTDLAMALEGKEDCDGELTDLAEKWLQTALYDPSREMVRDRYRIELLLSARSEPELRQVAVEIGKQKGFLMSHDSRAEVARYLFVEWPMQLKRKGLEKYHFTNDSNLSELEERLRAFPFHLYDKFLNDPVDFLREVYYNHVPRRQLFQLLSGIVLMELKGCAQPGKWGREGATEPLEQIERLWSSDSLTQTPEESVRQAIEELMVLKVQAGDKYVFTQKNQWAAVWGILKDKEGLAFKDLRDFCQKMGEWGFGKDSQCRIPCIYDSLVKGTVYIGKSFDKWDNKSQTGKRMQRAGAELRNILKKKSRGKNTP